jgi:hypothetical protein
LVVHSCGLECYLTHCNLVLICHAQATSSIVFWPCGGTVGRGSRRTPHPGGGAHPEGRGPRREGGEGEDLRESPCPVSASLVEVWTKVEAARQEYLNKMAVHTARGRQVLDFDKMLGEKRARLDDREWDLELRTATLARGINPWDNRDELMEFVELWRLLQDIKTDRITEVSWLAALVREVSQVLENLGLPPIPRIPWDPRTAGDVLGAVDVILECVKEAYDSGHGP